MTFVQFIMLYRSEDSAWGDLARDMMMDPHVTASMGYKKVRGHLERVATATGVVETLDAMWAFYRREGRGWNIA